MSTTLGVHISWTGLPGDSAVQWSDVSSDVTAIDTQRGRSTELDQVQTGTASIQLDNAQGAYTPGRAYGPELLPAAVKNTGDATQWTHGPHAALSINSAKNPPAAYVGSSTVLEIDMTSALAQEDQAVSARVPVTPGTAYKGSFLMQATATAAGVVSARLAFYNSAGAEITTGVDHDFAYRQYADVVRMSLPDTYHRMGANETLTNQSNALVGVDPMVCYNVGSAPSWSNYQGSGPGAAAFVGSSSSVAEPCGLHLIGQATPMSYEFWFNTSSAGPLTSEYQTVGGGLANPIAPTGSVDMASGRMWPALYVGTDGFLYAQGGVSSQSQVKSPILVNDGFWHHMVVVGGNGLAYYLDGVAFGTDVNTSNTARPIIGCGDFTHNTTLPHATGTPALIAKPATNFFTGSISDFAQYRHALSARDIADHYRHGVTAARRIPINSAANLGWWFPVQACGVAPAGAVAASLIMRTEQAYASSTLFLYSPSVKEINSNYGKILPRRKVRAFSTVGQNLIPPGLNLGYQTNAGGMPAGVDANEVGAWVPVSGQNVSYSSGATLFSPTTSVNTLPLHGPSGNGLAVPWMLIPGNTYAFAAQMSARQFAANSTGITLNFASAITSAPGSATQISGPSFNQAVVPGDQGWKTITGTFTIPSTYQQPELLMTFRATETVSSGSYGWVAAVQNIQLVDVTNGQAVPAYTPGDGTMPIFQGFVDKWESLTEYDGTASVVATCSDAMRIMGDTQLPWAPQAFGFQPDWRILGAWEMDGTANYIPVDPNGQIVGGSQMNANKPMSTMNYSPGFSNATLPGCFLGVGNSGVVWPHSPALYLMSFGKLATGMSTEFWFIPRQNTADPVSGYYGTGDQYVTAMAPFFSVYASVANGGSGGFNRAWCGWSDWNGESAVLTPGASNDVMMGGHIAIECVTSGGSAPTVTVTVYFNGAVLVQGTAEALTMPAAPQFQLGGKNSLAPTNHTPALPPFPFEVYAPASYAGTGLNWTARLAAFKSGRVSGNWSASTVIDGPPAQTVIPWLMGACGLARPPVVTGSPSTSTASLTDPPSFTSASGLDCLNTVTGQIGGLVCMSRYSAVMVQDSSYRTDAIAPYQFSALGATAPDGSLLFLSDIDRTWTEADVTQGNYNQLVSGDNTFALTNYPAYLRYGSHRQSIDIRAAETNETVRADTFLASYMIPAPRCDSAQFTVINQALASLVPLVDVGSRVVFTDLPANAPVDQYFAWVESVAVSAKADGGTLVPTYTFSLSPDFAHLPIQ